MKLTIPTSDKLKSLEKDLADKKGLAATAKAELLRLTKLIRNDSYETTVVNRWEPVTVATIGMRDAPTSNLSTGFSESDEARRREDDRDLILRGEHLADQPSIQSQIDQAHRLCRAINDAIESIVRDISREKAVLAQKYCLELKPQHDEDMALLCKALIDAHAAHVRLNVLRQHLTDNDLGFRGVCLLMPDAFIGHPLNKHSSFAGFLSSCKSNGYISKLPTEFLL
jgi:hypothetical protein